MTIDVDSIDVSNDGAFLKESAAVDYVPSGGYGHSASISMEICHVTAGCAAPETSLQKEIPGKIYDAEMPGGPICDSCGMNMRCQWPASYSGRII